MNAKHSAIEENGLLELTEAELEVVCGGTHRDNPYWVNNGFTGNTSQGNVASSSYVSNLDFGDLQSVNGSFGLSSSANNGGNYSAPGNVYSYSYSRR